MVANRQQLLTASPLSQWQLGKIQFICVMQQTFFSQIPQTEKSRELRLDLKEIHMKRGQKSVIMFLHKFWFSLAVWGCNGLLD
uniref:Uncharacterized protein n=1 Tax=Lepeophtheirus salmonis TaxID=72036 RepID=A0A0K2TC19_LEPSM